MVAFVNQVAQVGDLRVDRKLAASRAHVPSDGAVGAPNQQFLRRSTVHQCPGNAAGREGADRASRDVELGDGVELAQDDVGGAGGAFDHATRLGARAQGDTPNQLAVALDYPQYVAVDVTDDERVI